MLPQQSGQRMSHCHNAAAAATAAADVILGGPVLSWPGRQYDAPKTHLVVSARQNSAPSGWSQLRPCLPFFSWVKCSVCKSAPDSSTWQIFNQPGEWRVKKHCHSKDLCTSNPALSTATRYRYSAPVPVPVPVPFTAAAQLVARGLLITASALSHLYGKHWQMFPHALAFPYPLPFRLPPGAILNPLAHHTATQKSSGVN